MDTCTKRFFFSSVPLLLPPAATANKQPAACHRQKPHRMCLCSPQGDSWCWCHPTRETPRSRLEERTAACLQGVLVARHSRLQEEEHLPVPGHCPLLLWHQAVPGNSLCPSNTQHSFTASAAWLSGTLVLRAAGVRVLLGSSSPSH